MKPVCSALLLASMALFSSQAIAAEPTPLQQWWKRLNADINALVEQHRLVPPTPVTVRFRARRIWSGALSGELLDLGVADLGNDGQDELIALTSDSLLILSRRRGLIDVRQQVALPMTVAATRSRDPIGMLSIEETKMRELVGGGTNEVSVRARSSERGAGGVYSWRSGTLELDSEFVGYPLCDTGRIEAEPGRNYFLGSTAKPSVEPPLAPKVQLARCSRGLRDPLGNDVRYVSDVSVAGILSVRCEGGDDVCSQEVTRYSDVGYAHLVSDLDNDGHAEIVTTKASAQGDADRVQVFSHSTGEKRLLFEREFERGIVALTAGDFDGDGALELLAAERQAKAGRVSLWLLN